MKSNSSINKLDFFALQDRFINQEFQSSTRAFSEALHALHEKLPSVFDLIPLLESGNRDCQFAAAHIAALEAENSKPIFQNLIKLIDSPWEEVRDEVCDCFLSCTKDPNHYILLLMRLTDEKQQIRLKVITIIFGIETEILIQIRDALQKNIDFKDMFTAICMLLDGSIAIFDYEKIRLKITAPNYLIKISTYVLAYKLYGADERFFELVKLSNNSDIKRHYEIYFRMEGAKS